MEWCILHRKRTQVHVVPTDGEGGHKEPKDHSFRIAEIDCILGSQRLKKYKMATNCNRVSHDSLGLQFPYKREMSAELLQPQFQ